MQGQSHAPPAAAGKGVVPAGGGSLQQPQQGAQLPGPPQRHRGHTPPPPRPLPPPSAAAAAAAAGQDAARRGAPGSEQAHLLQILSGLMQAARSAPLRGSQAFFWNPSFANFFDIQATDIFPGPGASPPLDGTLVRILACGHLVLASVDLTGGCPQCAAGARTFNLLRVPPAAPPSAAAGGGSGRNSPGDGTGGIGGGYDGDVEDGSGSGQSDASNWSSRHFNGRSPRRAYALPCTQVHGRSVSSQVVLEAMAISSTGLAGGLQDHAGLPIQNIVVTSAYVADYVSTVAVCYTNEELPRRYHIHYVSEFYGALQPDRVDAAGNGWQAFKPPFNAFADAIDLTVTHRGVHSFLICRPDNEGDRVFTAVAFLYWFWTRAPTARRDDIVDYLNKSLQPRPPARPIVFPLSFANFMDSERPAPAPPLTPGSHWITDISKNWKEELAADEGLRQLLEEAKNPRPAPVPRPRPGYRLVSAEYVDTTTGVTRAFE